MLLIALGIGAAIDVAAPPRHALAQYYPAPSVQSYPAPSYAAPNRRPSPIRAADDDELGPPPFPGFPAAYPPPGILAAPAYPNAGAHSAAPTAPVASAPAPNEAPAATPVQPAPVQPAPGSRDARFGDPNVPASAVPNVNPPPARSTATAPAPAPNNVARPPTPPDQSIAAQPATEPSNLPEQLRRTVVDYTGKEPAGTIVVDTPNTYLYLILGQGKAMRYGIGVGREGFTWSGTERISHMAEWPDWHPPPEMIERQPYLPRFVAGGEGNPLGARALYLGKTEYRIHGTNQPASIGTFGSSGCIRMTNEDVTDLYGRVQLGTRVVVWPAAPGDAAQAALAAATGARTR
jgi:lipoprotein-anchoring transpeptidase ErfK/SrfK